MNYIYLGSPYTSNDADIVSRRVEQVEDAVAELVCEGFCVYSPVSHFHHIALRHDFPKQFEFWKAYNFSMLRVSGGIIILTLPGVGQSLGVTAEVAVANRLHMQVHFASPDVILQIARKYFSHCRYIERSHHVCEHPIRTPDVQRTSADPIV